jgi:hypothetical protein
MVPHVLDEVNIGCTDVSYPKLKMYVSELILDNHKYIPAAHVTRHCII